MTIRSLFVSLVVVLLLANAPDAYAFLEDLCLPRNAAQGNLTYKDGDTVKLAFGNSCAMSPHLAGHVQETGTGDDPLPLRVYTALNMTVNELIAFGNNVAKHHEGWIVNPDRSANPARFTPFEPMPGNSANPDDKTVCWQ